jgi:nicotinamide phosphoribosyltransferase
VKIFPPHATDFYKTGHRIQYPDNTTLVYSNFTCRGDKLANTLPDFDHKVVFFGLQGVCQWMLIDLWNKNFFQVPKQRVIEQYKRRMDSSLGPDSVGVSHIEALHELGYLPILIKALPEGSRVDMRVPLWTIRNTHKDFFWVTNYLETQLSAECWKSVTSATTAYEYRRLLDQYAEKTGTDKTFVPWQGHDFSFRGESGIFDASQTGAGHLLSFTGTDTISAIDYLEDYYQGLDTFVGGSVPATEHSVMCMGGQESEIDTFKRLIQKVYPRGIVSIVSDTWDFWQVITSYASRLKAEILTRDGKVVFRPDSGDPIKIIAGDIEAPIDSPQYKGAVECLWDIFGGTITSAGYKLLDSHVGLIYGDSITLERAHRILANLEGKGFASGSVVFGIGSYTYQFVTRDSFGTAIKATFGTVNGIDHQLSKAPKTDSGLKKSACGLLRVEKEGDNFVLYDRQTWQQENGGCLQPVFKDGQMLRIESIAQIRDRLLEARVRAFDVGKVA